MCTSGDARRSLAGSGETDARGDLARTRLLLEAANAFGQSESSAALLDRLIRIAARAVGCSRVSVNAVDHERGEVTVVGSIGEPALPLGTTIRFSGMGGALRRVIEQGSTLVFDYEDPLSQLTEDARSRALALGFVTVLTIPLVERGRVIGSFGLDEPFERREFTAADTQIAEAIALQAGIALQSIRMRERAEETARLNHLLADLDTVIHSSLEPDVIFERVVRESALAVGADAAVLEEKDGGNWPITHFYGLPRGVKGGHLTGGPPTVSLAALESGGALAIEDVATFAPADMLSIADLGIESIVAVPLVSRGNPIGTLIWVYRTPQRFSSQLVEFARRLGAGVGLALENARLYAREHSVAELLQESLLTLPGEVTAFEFASAYRSATHGARVGGDSYDLFQLADGRVCMMVGDVAGHGIGAAVLTSQLKYALRAQATAGATPSEAVLIANRMLYASTEPEIFVSVFFGIFDPKGNTLQYCNAGHVTIYLVEADGTLGRLAANGPVIGAAPTVPSVTNECAIPDGALLFLYTDGIVEVGPRTSMFGETRLGVLLARTWSGDPSQVVDEVLRAVSVFAQGDLRDDIAMLALGRRQGHAQP